MFDDILQQHAPEASQTLAPLEESDSIVSAKAAYVARLQQHARSIHDDPSFDLDAVDTRYSTAININRLRNKHVCVIGVGGIGTWVVRALVGMGVRDISIIDDDVVEIHNVGPQSHNIVDLGRPKVQAMQEEMLEHRAVWVNAHQARVENYQHLRELLGAVPDVLIITVDNMVLRNTLAGDLCENTGGAQTFPDMYIDVRMSLGGWNAYAMPLRSMAHLGGGWVGGQGSYRQFMDSALFEDAEGVQESCTERAIIYTGMSIGCYISALLHWTTDNPINRQERVDAFFDVNTKDSPFHWLQSFNSRTWKDTTTRVDPARNRRLLSAQKAAEDAQQMLRAVLRQSMPEHFPTTRSLAVRELSTLTRLFPGNVVVYRPNPAEDPEEVEITVCPRAHDLHDTSDHSACRANFVIRQAGSIERIRLEDILAVFEGHCPAREWETGTLVHIKEGFYNIDGNKGLLEYLNRHDMNVYYLADLGEGAAMLTNAFQQQTTQYPISYFDLERLSAEEVERQRPRIAQYREQAITRRDYVTLLAPHIQVGDKLELCSVPTGPMWLSHMERLTAYRLEITCIQEDAGYLEVQDPTDAADTWSISFWDVEQLYLGAEHAAQAAHAAQAGQAGPAEQAEQAGPAEQAAQAGQAGQAGQAAHAGPGESTAAGIARSMIESLEVSPRLVAQLLAMSIIPAQGASPIISRRVLPRLAPAITRVSSDSPEACKVRISYGSGHHCWAPVHGAALQEIESLAGITQGGASRRANIQDHLNSHIRELDRLNRDTAIYQLTWTAALALRPLATRVTQRRMHFPGTEELEQSSGKSIDFQAPEALAPWMVSDSESEQGWRATLGQVADLLQQHLEHSQSEL